MSESSQIERGALSFLSGRVCSEALRTHVTLHYMLRLHYTYINCILRAYISYILHLLLSLHCHATLQNGAVNEEQLIGALHPYPHLTLPLP